MVFIRGTVGSRSPSSYSVAAAICAVFKTAFINFIFAKSTPPSD